jgi:hypothetical protein
MHLSFQQLSFVCAGLGLGCFLWPVIQRLRGKGTQEPQTLEQKFQLRSKLWWAGFLLTLLALYLQRIAASQNV